MRATCLFPAVPEFQIKSSFDSKYGLRVVLHAEGLQVLGLFAEADEIDRDLQHFVRLCRTTILKHTFRFPHRIYHSALCGLGYREENDLCTALHSYGPIGRRLPSV